MGRDGLDVASGKFRAGVRVALGIGGRERRGRSTASFLPSLRPPASAVAPPGSGPQSWSVLARGKGHAEVWHVARRMRELLWDWSARCQFELAVLCPRLWTVWKHFAISCIFFFLTSQIGKLTTVANKTWALSSRNGTLCRRDRTGQNRVERQKREGGEAFCDWTVTRKGRREPLGRTRMEAIQLVRNRLCCRSYRCINTKCDFAPASAALSTVESKFTQKFISRKRC